MSQENNLNLNIDDILNKIKGVSEEQIEQMENGLNGMPGDRVLAYRDVMLAIESDNYEYLSNKILKLYIPYVGIKFLDVRIIMSIVDKILEKANGDNPKSRQYADIVYRLCWSLNIITSKLCHSGTKITSQDISDFVSLADKVLKCGDRTHINEHPVVYHVFVAVNSFLGMLNENIITEDATKIISIAQNVADDKNIKCGNYTIDSVFGALSSLLERSDLNQKQASDIVGIIRQFADKLKTDDSDLIQAVSEMLDTLRVLLLNKNNPSNLDAKDCMDLVGNLLKKIDQSSCTNVNFVRSVTAIVQYLAKNKNNIGIFTTCGFNIGDGQIKSLNADKLKEFAGEFMAKAIQQVLFPNLCKSSKLENEDKDENENDNQVTDNEINSTEKDNHGEMLGNYKSANELLTSNADNQIVSSYLANVEVSPWDKFKALPSWLWFMIREQKLISLDIYTRAVKHCSGDKDKTQDDNQKVKKLNLGNKDKDKDNSDEKISWKDKMQNVLGNQPKSENGQGKDDSETLGNGD